MVEEAVTGWVIRYTTFYPCFSVHSLLLKKVYVHSVPGDTRGSTSSLCPLCLSVASRGHVEAGRGGARCLSFQHGGRLRQAEIRFIPGNLVTIQNNTFKKEGLRIQLTVKMLGLISSTEKRGERIEGTWSECPTLARYV